MAAAVKIQDGDVVNVTLGGTVTAGTVIEFVDSIGVLLESGVSGDVRAVAMEGVYQVDKETGVAFAVGDALYWDATNDRLDKTTTNLPAGLCWAAAATGDTSAQVKLNAGLGQL